jgi:hypothetical protein
MRKRREPDIITRFADGGCVCSQCQRRQKKGIVFVALIVLPYDVCEQDVDEDWPLQILDHAGQPHNVLLHPGEMIWYKHLDNKMRMVLVFDLRRSLPETFLMLGLDPLVLKRSLYF